MDTILNNLIDKNFIYQYNKDLLQMPTNRLKQHYKLTGKSEGRIVSNLHIQQILRNRYFNIEFYKGHYDDVANMSPRDIINQYITIGQKEGRIVSKKHACVLTKNPEFDIEFYKSQHPDLHNMNPAQLVTHYIKYGKQEGRIVSKKHNMAPANIISISHSLGGGTQTYIDNLNSLYNIDLYKSTHSDLQHMSPLKLVNHYIGFGKKENRQCT